MAAMEVSQKEKAIVFLFTHTHERRDFKFCIGISEVQFVNLED